MNVNAASLSDIKGFLRRPHHADDLLRCFTSARENEDAQLLVKHNRLRFISCSGSSRGTLGQFPTIRHWKPVWTQQAAGTSCPGSRRGRFEDVLELCFQTFSDVFHLLHHRSVILVKIRLNLKLKRFVLIIFRTIAQQVINQRLDCS